MLRLSKKADYALMALAHLAGKGPDGAASAREIAERYHIPLELLAKVLQQLAREGLVTSQKGIRGGYHLTKATAAISVAEIIRAIDGPLTITACSTDDGDTCEQFMHCNVRDPLWRVTDRIVAALERVSLAELVGGEVAPVTLVVTRSSVNPVQA